MVLPRFIILYSFIVLNNHKVYSYNILMISPLASLSHDNIMKSFAKALAIKGHQVDILSHFPMDKPMERINHTSLAGTSEILVNAFTADFFTFSYSFLLDVMMIVPGHKPCTLLYKSSQFRDLKQTTKKYDVFITELFASECILPWAWYFNIPSVLVTASLPLPWNTERFGIPDNPSYTPTYFGDFGAEMTFLERAYNIWQYALARYKFWRSTKISDQIARAFFGPQMPPLEEVAYNSSLLLSNSHFSIHDARALPPNVIEIAGLHIGQPKPLNKHLNKIIDTNRRGSIYFSMGSLFAAESFSDKILQDILNAFSQLPYDIIWRVRTNNLSKKLNFSANVHLENWVPQLDLLCDPRVKLFFSHGGMMGMQEAIYCGVPILNLPVLADQKYNSRHAEIMGFGLVLKDINTKSILEACEKLLNDPKYAKNAKRVSREFMDRPMSAVDTATFWTEYVIRNQGALKMQSYAKRLKWYEYYMVDLFISLIVSLLVVLYLLNLGIKFILNRRDRKKIKQN